MSNDNTIATPAIGQPWPEQGGIYVGTRLIEGHPRHVIIPGGVNYDIWASYDKAEDRIAGMGRINGFYDWRHGEQRDLMLAYINTPEQFHRQGMESIQITSTPCGEGYAWSVDFENGGTITEERDREFLVRPFRYVVARGINQQG